MKLLLYAVLVAKSFYGSQAIFVYTVAFTFYFIKRYQQNNPV